MKLLIHIYPDEDGAHCGECPNIKGIFIPKCKLFKRTLSKERNAWSSRYFEGKRLPECLEAEREAKEEA
jgi:hypothetical protein